MYLSGINGQASRYSVKATERRHDDIKIDIDPPDVAPASPLSPEPTSFEVMQTDRYDVKAIKHKPDDFRIDIDPDIAQTSLPPPESKSFEIAWRPALRAFTHAFGQQLISALASRVPTYSADFITQSSNLPELVQRWIDPALPLSVRLSELDNFLRDVRAPYAASCQKLVSTMKRLLDGELQQGGLNAWLAAAADMEVILREAGTVVLGRQAAQTWSDYLRSLQEWSQRIRRLSRASTDNPTAFFHDLLDQDLLPDWLQDVLRTTDEWMSKLYAQKKTLQSAYVALNGYAEAYRAQTSATGRLGILTELLLDDEAISLVRWQAPEMITATLDLLTLLRDEAALLSNQAGTFRRVLLISDRLTSESFENLLRERIGSQPSGHELANMLHRTRDTLRGGDAQEKTLRILLNLTDRSMSWRQFLQHSARDFFTLHQWQEAISATLASTYLQAAHSLYEVLDDTFWKKYGTASWDSLPRVVAGAIHRDLQRGADSRLGEALQAMSGINMFQLSNQLIQLRRARTWREFLSEAAQLSSQVIHLTQYAGVINTAIEWANWLMLQVSRMRVLRRLWRSIQLDENTSLQDLREQLQESLRSWPEDKVFIAMHTGLDWLDQIPRAMLEEWSPPSAESKAKPLTMPGSSSFATSPSWMEEKLEELKNRSISIASRCLHGVLLGPNPLEQLIKHTAVNGEHNTTEAAYPDPEAQEPTADETLYWRNMTLSTGLSALILLVLARGIRFSRSWRGTRTIDLSPESARLLMDSTIERVASATDNHQRLQHPDMAHFINCASSAETPELIETNKDDKGFLFAAEITLYVMSGLMLVPTIYGCHRWFSARQKEVNSDLALEKQELRLYTQTGDLSVLNEWLHQRFPEIPRHVWLAGRKDLESSSNTSKPRLLAYPDPNPISAFISPSFNNRISASDTPLLIDNPKAAVNGLKKTIGIPDGNNQHTLRKRGISILYGHPPARGKIGDSTMTPATIVGDITRPDTDATLRGLSIYAAKMRELWFDAEHPISQAIKCDRITVCSGRLNELIPSSPMPTSTTPATGGNPAPSGGSMPVVGWIIEENIAKRVGAVLCQLDDFEQVSAYIEKEAIVKTQIVSAPDLWRWIDLNDAISKVDDFLCASSTDAEAFDMDATMYRHLLDTNTEITKKDSNVRKFSADLLSELYSWSRQILQAGRESPKITLYRQKNAVIATQLLLIDRFLLRQRLAEQCLMEAAALLDIDSYRHKLHPPELPNKEAARILQDDKTIADTRVLALKMAFKANTKHKLSNGSNSALLDMAVEIEKNPKHPLNNSLLHWESIYHRFIEIIKNHEDDDGPSLKELSHNITWIDSAGDMNALRDFYKKISLYKKI